jgi:hypothetical protein
LSSTGGGGRGGALGTSLRQEPWVRLLECLVPLRPMAACRAPSLRLGWTTAPCTTLQSSSTAPPPCLRWMLA